MKKWSLFLLIAMLLFALTACGKEAEPEVVEEPPVVEEEPPAEEPEEVPEEPDTGFYNPLTGEMTETDLSQNRPVAAMLNTLKKALPQSGPSAADMFIEIPEEGGITRVMALFQDLNGVGNIGTVRSTREYFVYLAMGYDAMLVHAGASYSATEELEHYGYTTLNYMSHGDLYWRDAERKKNVGTEHSLYTSGENLMTYLADTTSIRTTHEEGYESPFSFAEDGTPAGGGTAQSIEVVFSGYKTTSFAYDAASKSYLVSFFDGQPYVDETTGTQVGVTNVIVVPTVQSTKSDGQLQEFDLTSGTGYFACGGQYVEINWAKNGETEPLTFTNQDGTPLNLGVGTTYICVLDQDQPVTIQ